MTTFFGNRNICTGTNSGMSLTIGASGHILAGRMVNTNSIKPASVALKETLENTKKILFDENIIKINACIEEAIELGKTNTKIGFIYPSPQFSDSVERELKDYIGLKYKQQGYEIKFVIMQKASSTEKNFAIDILIDWKDA